jgi:outer membrane protein assembly factor BamD (BamD/ComL family)
VKLSETTVDELDSEWLCREEIAMSVSGISSSNFSTYSTQDSQNQLQQIQQAFQQLGQDLQSGNLSGAQSDFATLQQLAPQLNSVSSAQSNNPIAQAFAQLSKDLQSGNLSAAQQDFTTIQQDFQNQAQGNQGQTAQGHHHHHGGGSGSSTLSQLFEQLGQALQSGNLSTAQKTFSTLQQDFLQSAQNSGSPQTSSQPNSSSVSVNA